MPARKGKVAPGIRCLSILLLSIFIAQLPAYADQYFDYGVQLLKRKDYANARSYFDKRLKLAPQDAKAYYYKALTYHYAGDKKQAKALYESILDLFPDSPEAKLAADNVEKMQIIEDENNNSLSDEERSQRKLQMKTARQEGEKTRQEQAINAAKKAYQDSIAPLLKKKEQIMTEARAQAKQIMDDAKKQVGQSEDEVNQLTRRSGNLRNAAMRNQKQIMQDATDQADSIINVAQARADGIQIPPEPDWSKFPGSMKRTNK